MSEYIEVTGVRKKIRNMLLIDSVSLTIAKGRTVGFVGNNGSGKTLLLKLISGLYRVTDGIIIVDGKILGRDVDFPDNMGVIIETPGFISNMSGYKNLRMLARIKNKITDQDIREAIRFVGLDPDDKKPVGKYSLGMRQRLGLAQAIMEKPDILVLDEPFNGLDREGCEEMRKYLLELKSQGKTILIASHLDKDIELLCDDVYEMDQGRIVAEHING
jgi:ABC-2 type transport system ATP-binding protein